MTILKEKATKPSGESSMPCHPRVSTHGRSPLDCLNSWNWGSFHVGCRLQIHGGSNALTIGKAPAHPLFCVGDEARERSDRFHYRQASQLPRGYESAAGEHYRRSSAKISGGDALHWSRIGTHQVASSKRASGSKITCCVRGDCFLFSHRGCEARTIDHVNA